MIDNLNEIKNKAINYFIKSHEIKYKCPKCSNLINGLNEKEIDFFEGSGKIMRHIKIKSLQDIDEKKLAQLIKLVNEKAVCQSC